MNILNTLGSSNQNISLGHLGGFGLLGGMGNLGIAGLSPQLLQMIQMVLGMTGGGLNQGLFSGLGSGGGAMLPMGAGSFGSGGLASGFANLASSLGNFLGGFGGGDGLTGFWGGGSSDGGASWSGGGATSRGASYNAGGGDTYVPGGTAANGPGGFLASGGQGAAAVAWAQSQLGVSESQNGDVVRGYSNGAWQPWCADFVSKAFENSGGSPFGHMSSVQQILDWGKENGRFISAGTAAANPDGLRVGDVAVWKQNGKSHVGLVTGINPDGTFTTIEGNTSDKVAERNHSFEDPGLTGFVRAVEEQAPVGAKTVEVSSSQASPQSKSTSLDSSSVKDQKSAGTVSKDKSGSSSSDKNESSGSEKSASKQSDSSSKSKSSGDSSSSKSSSKN